MERSEGLCWWVAQQCSWTASTCTPTSWLAMGERTLPSVRSRSRWAGPSCPWPPLEVCLVGSLPWSCLTAIMASVSLVRLSWSHLLPLLWCCMFVKHMASCCEISGLAVLFSLIESHWGFASLIFKACTTTPSPNLSQVLHCIIICFHFVWKASFFFSKKTQMFIKHHYKGHNPHLDLISWLNICLQ